MNIEKISASGIKTFEQCPLKFYALYILKIKDDKVHPNTVLGSAVHKMTELSFIQIMEALKRNEKIFVDPINFKKQVCDELKVEPSLFKTIDELIENEKRWGYFRNIQNTVGCELRVEFLLPDGTLVKGFIDRLDVKYGEADIIDIKTQKNMFEPNELKDNWQALIYNIGARKLFPQIMGTASVSFWMLRHQVQRTFKTAQDAEADMVKLSNMVASIKACDDPQPCPSPLCQWCPYVKQCPTNGENARDRLKRMIRK